MLSIAGLLALGLWRAREAADRRRAVPKVWRNVSVEPASLRQAPRINLEGGVDWLNTAGPIDSLRVDSERAFALYHGSDGSDYFMPMALEGGSWRVAGLAPTEFPDV